MDTTNERVLNYKGGLSDGVSNSYHFQKYTKSECVGGYYGSGDRTDKRDQIIEKYLREEQGLGDEGISHWLSSGNSRHFMHNVDYKTTQKEFKELVKEYAGQAFLEVTLWSHPDHTGFLASTNRLREALKNHIK
jgi:hypothetical protein